jgi:hypothetical protein
MFKVTDPQGNFIVLTRECWERHICVVHTEMRTLLSKVRQTLITPDYIYTSKSNPNSHLYFREYHDPRLNCRYILVAVYREADSTKGYMQSAYPVKSLSKGGTLEWKKR